MKDPTIRSKLNEIDILFRKGLYKQGHKLIDQTKKKAEQNEQFETLLQLINMEQKLLVSAMAFKSLKSYKERIKVFMDETKNVLNTIENIKEQPAMVASARCDKTMRIGASKVDNFNCKPACR